MLDNRINTTVNDYLSVTFENLLILFINKPTKITKTNVIMIDHILTNDFVNTNSYSGIVKSDISDYFPIFLIMSEQFFNSIQNETTIKKGEINKKSKQYFMEILSEVN